MKDDFYKEINNYLTGLGFTCQQEKNWIYTMQRNSPTEAVFINGQKIQSQEKQIILDSVNVTDFGDIYDMDMNCNIMAHLRIHKETKQNNCIIDEVTFDICCPYDDVNFFKQHIN